MSCLFARNRYSESALAPGVALYAKFTLDVTANVKQPPSTCRVFQGPRPAPDTLLRLAKSVCEYRLVSGKYVIEDPNLAVPIILRSKDGSGIEPGATLLAGDLVVDLFTLKRPLSVPVVIKDWFLKNRQENELFGTWCSVRGDLSIFSPRDDHEDELVLISAPLQNG